MKKAFTLVILLIIVALQAQSTTLHWEKYKTADFGTQKLALPFFSDEGYSHEGGNIYIHIKRSSENTFNVKNYRWEKVPTAELYDLNAAGLPLQDYSIASHYKTADGAAVSELSIATFKKDINNTVYRLASFDLASVPQNLEKISGTKTIGTPENPLASGTFYKIKIDKTGIFKITAKFLRDNGINPSNINPKNFRIYGNGGAMLPEYNGDARFATLQENAIQVVGEADGRWDEQDYALFYAQGADGYHLYKTAGGNGNYRTETRIQDTPAHLKNIYEDYAFYFINFDKGAGKRVQDADAPLPAQLISRYDAYQFINEDKKNLMAVGRTWVGDSFSTEQVQNFTTDTPLLPSDTVIYRAQSVGFHSQGNSLKFSINGLQESSQSIATTDQDFRALNFNGKISGLSGNQLSLKFNPNLSANPGGTIFFDYAEVQYRQDLKYNGGQMNFRDYSISEGKNQLYGFSVSNADAAEQIWDVSDPTNAARKMNKSGTKSVFNFGYIAASQVFNNEFIAFTNVVAYAPQFVGRVENQDLSALSNVDYLILTNTQLAPQAQRLADYHKKNEGWNVQIVDIQKIYNEYSSGSQDLTAIRDFVTRLNTQTGRLKYVFILGDGSYDYKNRISNNTNVVPAYESEESGNLINSFVSDDYITMTASQSTPYLIGTLPDLPVGRLTAANASEAEIMIDKTLAYYNALPRQSTPFGDWRMNMDFVTDDDLDGTTPFHAETDQYLKQNFEGATDKPEYHIRKLYLDAFPAESSAGGQRYPAVNQAISADISNSLYMMYFGHGGINGWAQERVLTSAEVANFNNFNSVYSRFPLVSTITCEFTLWDDPAINSVGEQVSKHSTGGAATMITSSRAIDVSYGVSFSGRLIGELFKLYNDDFLPLGDAFLSAKKTMGPNGNNFRVNFLGDPAMKLARPKRLITIDNIATPVPGQMRALDFVTVKGHIANADRFINKNFNGKVSIDIFDKPITKTTLDNDQSLGKMTYMEEGSAIVKASGAAANGEFQVQFYIPKDINYTLGTGRLLAYADNSVFDVFNNQPQAVGGINPDGIKDNTPPKVSLFLNNTNFADGGITNANPTLLACLSDDTGINSTGSGIGHDITVYLDGQVINTIILNDYYSSGDGNGCASGTLANYQKGSVSYPFRNLAPGKHTLTFKVWDINNNSTIATLNFTVKDENSTNLAINRLLNWPNPFTNRTYIQFEHNCDDVLNVNAQIYTITGKLVRTITSTVTAEPFLQGFRTPRQAIEWDGKDNFGDAVGRGTYIYKVFVRGNNQEKCKGSATGVEKMVLLK